MSHIHRFKETGHGVELATGEEDWSFACSCGSHFKVYRRPGRKPRFVWHEVES